MQVWIVGDSMVHWAAARALKHRDGLQLGLGQGFWLSWKGKRGAHMKETFNKLSEKLQVASTKPHVILLHIGTNDLGSTPFHELRNSLKEGLEVIWIIVPQARIIWSDVIPRRYYASARSSGRVDKLRRKLNWFARRWVIHNRDGFTSHQITAKQNELYVKYLSHMGYDYG